MTLSYKTISIFPPAQRRSDVTLLEAAKQMDREALVEIFDIYSQALYNYAFRLCGDALMADYIVGDVFAKLLEHLSAGKGPTSNLRSYLYEITYHLVVDEARHSHRSTSFETSDFLTSEPSATHVSAENRVLFEKIQWAIKNHLTADQRHVVILRFLEGLSLQETAQVIGKEVSNVKVIQTRAIAALRKALDHLDYKDV
jgi:RNA polymerase sigma-70 factor (ECF subfamily)